jgi:hypothetical protein
MKEGLRKIHVNCRRGSRLLTTHEFGVPASLSARPMLLDRDTLIAEAKRTLLLTALLVLHTMESASK